MHNLEQRNGNYSFAGLGKTWHGLGTILDERMTAKEALELSGQNFKVVKVPTMTETFITEEGQIIEPVETGYYSTLRTDTKEVLGQVGERYTIAQNEDAFAFFDPIIDRSEAIYETAGVLGKGEVTFLTAKMPDYIKVGNNDDVELYVVLVNGHNGKTSTCGIVTPVRVVCQNTLTASLRRAVNKVTFRHTPSIKEKIGQGHKLLNIVSMLSNELDLCFNEMAKTKVNDLKAEQVFKRFLGIQDEDEASTKAINKLESLNEYYFTGYGQQKVVGSAWGVFNAMTGYLEHVQTFKNDSVKMHNALDGKKHNTAMKLSLELI